MRILNFAYPITDEHQMKIEDLANHAISEIRNIPVNFELERPFDVQAREIVDSIGLTPHEWQTPPVLVNLPSLNFGAVTILVELHGRIGHFPSVLRTRPVSNGGLTYYEIAEIINLQNLRVTTRNERR